jgi:hypothetical protein
MTHGAQGRGNYDRGWVAQPRVPQGRRSIEAQKGGAETGMGESPLSRVLGGSGAGKGTKGGGGGAGGGPAAVDDCGGGRRAECGRGGGSGERVSELRTGFRWAGRWQSKFAVVVVGSGWEERSCGCVLNLQRIPPVHRPKGAIW